MTNNPRPPRNPRTPRPPRNKGTQKKSAKGRSVIQIISEIKQGLFDPKQLKKSDRLLCVQYLGSEGLSISELAHFLKVDERTIMRDRKEIRKNNAIQYDPELAGQLAGQILQDAEASCSRIQRATRSRNTPIEAIINAEHVKSDIKFKTYQLLQSLGFLPKDAPPRLKGISGNYPDLKELGEITSKLYALDNPSQSSDSSHSSKQKG